MRTSRSGSVHSQRRRVDRAKKNSPSETYGAKHGQAAAPHDPHAYLLTLQQSAGDQAVTALLAQAQTKLEVGAADDSLEQEADSIARQVVDQLARGERSARASRGTRRRLLGGAG